MKDRNEDSLVKTIAFVNAEVYTPNRVINSGQVIVRGKRITHVGRAGEFNLKGAEVIDVKGHYLAPGFVDTHVHGGGGGDFIDGTLAAVKAAAGQHLLAGTTTLYPSTTTHRMENILRALKVLRGVVGKNIKGMAFIPGVHVEGPFLTKSEPGCHNLKLLLDPVPPHTTQIMQYADIIKRMTLAPEDPGAMDFIRELTAKGIMVSIGHSAATYEQVALAIEAGATHVTHLYNAMSTIKRVNAKRYAGVLEAALEREDLTTEIIADGKHLPTCLLRIAFKCKGPEKLILISDCMRALGLPEGKLYEVCGQMALYEDGVGYTPDKQAFASSAIPMCEAVRHMVQTVGVSLKDVLTMASLTPAKLMGIDSFKGSLASGKDADLLILDRASLRPVYVMAMGQQAVDRR